jgi:hypothetical protein
VRAPAIERRREAYRRFAILRRPGANLARNTHHALKVAGAHRNVGIVDEQKIVARVRGELRQRAHLAVRAQPLGALHQPDRPLGKLGLQLLHGDTAGSSSEATPNSNSNSPA